MTGFWGPQNCTISSPTSALGALNHMKRPTNLRFKWKIIASCPRWDVNCQKIGLRTSSFLLRPGHQTICAHRLMISNHRSDTCRKRKMPPGLRKTPWIFWAGQMNFHHCLLHTVTGIMSMFMLFSQPWDTTEGHGQLQIMMSTMNRYLWKPPRFARKLSS